MSARPSSKAQPRTAHPACGRTLGALRRPLIRHWPVSAYGTRWRGLILVRHHAPPLLLHVAPPAPPIPHMHAAAAGASAAAAATTIGRSPKQ